MKKLFCNTTQLVFPILLLLYFRHYADFINLIQLREIDLGKIVTHILIYVALLVLIIYLVISSYTCSIRFRYLLIGWIEVVAIFIIPITNIIPGNKFLYVKMHPVEYINCYGAIVVVYSLQLIWWIYKNKKAPNK